MVLNVVFTDHRFAKNNASLFNLLCYSLALILN